MSKHTITQLDRIIQIHMSTEGKIRPHAVVAGPSGSGKTYNVQRLCAKYELPMIEINAAQITKEGMAGNSLSKALTPLMQMMGQPCVCLVDEFDKLFISNNSNSSGAHEVTTGVQNEFLKVLESETTAVFGDYGKYVQARVDNVLFIFAGAFNGEPTMSLDKLRDFGVKTEFLGRVGLVYNMEKMPLTEMLELVHNSSLIELYTKLMDGSDPVKAKEVIGAVIEKGYEHNTIGARQINTLVHQYYIDGGITELAAKETTFTKTLEFTSTKA
jgi:ATP-dependent protease Clp ATPase subunit